MPAATLLVSHLEAEVDPQPEAEGPRSVSISPAAVVVTVALLAQLGQRVVRWLGGKSRRRRGRIGARAR